MMDGLSIIESEEVVLLAISDGGAVGERGVDVIVAGVEAVLVEIGVVSIVVKVIGAHDGGDQEEDEEVACLNELEGRHANVVDARVVLIEVVVNTDLSTVKVILSWLRVGIDRSSSALWADQELICQEAWSSGVSDLSCR